LELFIRANSALVRAEIEKELHPAIERVTIYRTLRIFLQKGVIHLIPTTDNSIKYALTRENANNKKIRENHVHFLCKNCSKTLCLSDVYVPNIKLIKGYKIQSYLVIKGICSDCK
jgi:Fur family transcriptional regulator, ferric uptake regulator